MFYSPRRNFLFVHIPKTGGTSLSLALESVAVEGDVMAGDTPKAVWNASLESPGRAQVKLSKHSTYSDVISAIVPEDVFIFTIVRNPWDRVVSYYHWLKLQSFDHPSVQHAKQLSFREFLFHPLTISQFRTAHYESYVCDLKAKDCCNFYLRFEQLADDVQTLSQKLNLKLELPHVNRSERNSWINYFDDETLAHWGTVCARDIRRFRYRYTK